MSDPYTGARAPDGSPAYGEVPTQPAPVYPAETYPAETYAAETYPAQTYVAGTTTTDTTRSGQDSSGSGVKDQVKQAAGESAHAAGHAAGEVKDTAKEQARRVGSEAKSQARGVASEVRDRVSGEAKSQSDRLSGGLRELAGQLDEMRGDREGTPAATVVGRVADGGRQFADYLDRNGPEGVLSLATALAAGFVVGRLGKSVMKADEPAGKPAADDYRSDAYGTGAPAAAYDTVTPTTAPTTATEYQSTGTGTPVVAQEYVATEYTTPGYTDPGYATPGYDDRPGSPR